MNERVGLGCMPVLHAGTCPPCTTHACTDSCPPPSNNRTHLEVLDGFHVVFGSGAEQGQQGVREGLQDGDENEAEHAPEEEQAAHQLARRRLFPLRTEVGH